MYLKFKKLLDEKGITPYKVSQDTGIATSTLTSWKQGAYNPKVDKLVILAEYFGVPLDYFIKEDSDG